MTTAAFTENYLLFVVLPLWLISGLADWACHRASRIEATSGTKESLIHLLLLAEAAIPLLMALFLEINGLVIIVMLAAWILHELTSYWDVRYAYGKREVSAIEQRIHDYLGTVPFMALSFVVVLHWQQFLALFGAGPESLHLEVRLKEPPLPAGYIFGLLAAITVLDFVPFLEELCRTVRAKSTATTSTRAPSDVRRCRGASRAADQRCR